MEKRVITPTEVYDALQTNIAELQRIKFRLGVDSAFDDSKAVVNKTPDDVIQNLTWAANAMPSFALGQPLTQYDPQSLEKSPSDVFAIASLTLRKLRHYKRLRGIHTRANQPPAVTGLRPRHVYQKTLECLKKVGELRRQAGFAASATPYFPMRVITPNDVFALASQLDRALGLIYATIDMPQDMLTAQDAGSKTSSEVFRVMWQISYELDAILGSQGQTPNDVYRMASYAVAHIQRLQHKLGYQSHAVQPARIPDLKPVDVIEQARTLLATISQLKKRAGIFGSGLPVARHDAIVTPNDVFNLVSVIIAELIDVEIHLGISNQLALPAVTHDKTPSDVYQQLQFAERLLHDMLGGTIE